MTTVQATSTASSPGEACAVTGHGVAEEPLVGRFSGDPRPHGPADVGLRALHGPEASVRWRLHGEQRDHLKKVVLDHVAQTASGLVERAAASPRRTPPPA